MAVPTPFAPIGDLAARVREPGGALALAEETLARIARGDHGGAICEATPERARAAASAVDLMLAAGRDPGPLAGIPFAVKDLFDLAGHATRAGTRLLDRNLAERDAFAVAQLLAAGMVPVAKTHTVQFAYGGVGINHDAGTPRNPWAREPHVAGGSSSGSAVAVASGLVPAALGTDTGGSVRIPAALCGICGLKTTVGRIGRGGVYPLSRALDSVGPLARSVADLAALATAMLGVDPRDPSTRAEPLEDLGAGLGRGIEGLRIGVAEGVFFEDVDPEVEAAVRAAAEVLSGLGARVDTADFALAAAARDLNRDGLVIAAEAYTENRRFVDEHFAELDPVVAHRMAFGRDVPAHRYLATMREREALAARAAGFLDDFDALLAPTTQIPARPVAAVDATPESYREHNLRYLRNTSIGNILGLCGLSVPCGFTADGLPIGLMLYAAPRAEARVLRIGHAYERATDWLRPPPAAGEAGA